MEAVVQKGAGEIMPEGTGAQGRAALRSEEGQLMSTPTVVPGLQLRQPGTIRTARGHMDHTSRTDSPSAIRSSPSASCNNYVQRYLKHIEEIVSGPDRKPSEGSVLLLSPVHVLNDETSAQSMPLPQRPSDINASSDIHGSDGQVRRTTPTEFTWSATSEPPPIAPVTPNTSHAVPDDKDVSDPLPAAVVATKLATRINQQGLPDPDDVPEDFRVLFQALHADNDRRNNEFAAALDAHTDLLEELTSTRSDLSAAHSAIRSQAAALREAQQQDPDLAGDLRAVQREIDDLIDSLQERADVAQDVADRGDALSLVRDARGAQQRLESAAARAEKQPVRIPPPISLSGAPSGVPPLPVLPSSRTRWLGGAPSSGQPSPRNVHSEGPYPQTSASSTPSLLPSRVPRFCRPQSRPSHGSFSEITSAADTRRSAGQSVPIPVSVFERDSLTGNDLWHGLPQRDRQAVSVDAPAAAPADGCQLDLDALAPEEHLGEEHQEAEAARIVIASLKQEVSEMENLLQQRDTEHRDAMQQRDAVDAQLREENSTLQQENAKLQEEGSKLQEASSKLQQESSKLQALLSDRAAEIGVLEASLADARHKLDLMQRCEEAGANMCTELAVEAKKSQQHLEDLRSQKAALEGDLLAANESKQKLERAVASLQAERSHQNEKLAAVCTQLQQVQEDAEAATGQATSDFTRLRNELAALQRLHTTQLTEHQGSADELVQQLDQAQADALTVQRQLDDSASAHSQLTSELHQAQTLQTTQLADALQDAAAARAREAELAAELQQVQESLAALQTEHTEAAAIGAKLAAELKELHVAYVDELAVERSSVTDAVTDCNQLVQHLTHVKQEGGSLHDQLQQALTVRERLAVVLAERAEQQEQSDALVAAAEGRVDELSQHVEELQAESAAVQTQLHEELQAAGTTLSELQSQLAAATDAQRSSEEAVRALQQEKTDLSGLHCTAQQELEHLNSQLAELQSRADTAEHTNKLRGNQVEELQRCLSRDLNAHQLAEQTADETITELQHKLEGQIEAREATEVALAGMAADMAALVSELESLAESGTEQIIREHSTHRLMQQEMRQRMEESGQQSRQLAEQLSQHRARADELEAELEAARGKAAAAEGSLAEAQGALASERVRAGELESELEAVRERVAQAERSSADAREVLDSERGVHTEDRDRMEVLARELEGERSKAAEVERSLAEAQQVLAEEQDARSAECQRAGELAIQLESERSKAAEVACSLADLQRALAEEQDARAAECQRAGELETQLESERNRAAASERSLVDVQQALAVKQDEHVAESRRAGELVSQLENERTRAADMECSVADAQRALAAKQDEHAAERQRAGELDVQLEGERSRAAAVERSLADLQQALAAKQDEHAAECKRAGEIGSQLEEERIKAGGLERSLADLQQVHTAKQDEHAAECQRAGALGSQLEEERAKAGELERSLADLQQALAAEQKEHAAERDRAAALGTQLEAERGRVKDIEHSLSEVRSTLAAEQAALAAERTLAGDLGTQLGGERDRAARVESSLSTAHESLVAERSRLEELREQLGEKSAHAARVEHDLEASKATVAEEQQRAQGLEGELAGEREQVCDLKEQLTQSTKALSSEQEWAGQLEQQLLTAHSNIAEREAEVVKAKEELAEQRVKATQLEEDVKVVREQMSRITEDLAAAAQMHAAASQDAEAKARADQATILELEGACKQSSDRVEAEQARAEGLVAELEAANTALGKVREQVVRLEGESASLGQQMAAAAREQSAANSAFRQLQSEVAAVSPLRSRDAAGEHAEAAQPSEVVRRVHERLAALAAERDDARAAADGLRAQLAHLGADLEAAHASEEQVKQVFSGELREAHLELNNKEATGTHFQRMTAALRGLLQRETDRREALENEKRAAIRFVKGVLGTSSDTSCLLTSRSHINGSTALDDDDGLKTSRTCVSSVLGGGHSPRSVTSEMLSDDVDVNAGDQTARDRETVSLITVLETAGIGRLKEGAERAADAVYAQAKLEDEVNRLLDRIKEFESKLHACARERDGYAEALRSVVNRVTHLAAGAASAGSSRLTSASSAGSPIKGESLSRGHSTAAFSPLSFADLPSRSSSRGLPRSTADDGNFCLLPPPPRELSLRGDTPAPSLLGASSGSMVACNSTATTDLSDLVDQAVSACAAISSMLKRLPDAVLAGGRTATYSVMPDAADVARLQATKSQLASMISAQLDLLEEVHNIVASKNSKTRAGTASASPAPGTPSRKSAQTAAQGKGVPNLALHSVKPEPSQGHASPQSAQSRSAFEEQVGNMDRTRSQASSATGAEATVPHYDSMQLPVIPTHALTDRNLNMSPRRVQAMVSKAQAPHVSGTPKLTVSAGPDVELSRFLRKHGRANYKPPGNAMELLRAVSSKSFGRAAAGDASADGTPATSARGGEAHGDSGHPNLALQSFSTQASPPYSPRAAAAGSTPDSPMASDDGLSSQALEELTRALADAFRTLVARLVARLEVLEHENEEVLAEDFSMHYKMEKLEAAVKSLDSKHTGVKAVSVRANLPSHTSVPTSGKKSSHGSRNLGSPCASPASGRPSSIPSFQRPTSSSECKVAHSARRAHGKQSSAGAGAEDETPTSVASSARSPLFAGRSLALDLSSVHGEAQESALREQFAVLQRELQEAKREKSVLRTKLQKERDETKRLRASAEERSALNSKTKPKVGGPRPGKQPLDKH